MLVTFKSKAAAEVLMYEEHAKHILDLLHKDVKRGIITSAETANAIATLDAEIAESKLHSASEEAQRDMAVRDNDNENSDNDEHAQIELVSFATRVYPLLEMLRAAHRSGKDVVWGV